MLKTGLVSVTFRKLSPLEIVQLVKQAGLDGIEWGGDIHVPHGNLLKAKEVHEMTEKAGLITYSYGSYYRVGCDNPFTFEEVLATAIELKTNTIRVWAGEKKSIKTSDLEWDFIIQDSKRIALLAQKHHIDISFEYHDHTLTDTNDSAIKLMKEINMPNVRLYWQPPVGADIQTRIEDLKRIQDYLSHLHVFHWNMYDRLPLQIGEAEWKLYLEQLPHDGKERYCSLEFVRNEDINQFLEDATILIKLVKNR